MLIQIQMLFIQWDKREKERHDWWKPLKSLFPILAFEYFVRVVALLFSFLSFQLLTKCVLTCKNVQCYYFAVIS